MIGIITKNRHRSIAEEFFQLFKVPWEFHEGSGNYNVVIVSDDVPEIPAAKLVILFGADNFQFDKKYGLSFVSTNTGGYLVRDGAWFPVYREMGVFHRSENTLIGIADNDMRAGMAIDAQGQKVLRIGYNIFEEVEFLLSEGQPAEYARIPTLELHIAILRDLITGAGIPIVEIPPVPNGYEFATCLTHDIDFIEIRDHKFDHTVFGFLYRALNPFASHPNITWKKYFRNLKAAFSLPGIYLGFLPDFWNSLMRYSEIEKETKSTFYFIPFVNRPGKGVPEKWKRYRAAKYEIRKHTESIRELIRNGHEVGLHGIDAWNDPEKGRIERRVIQEITGEESIGVRMHWLYFSDDTGRSLEDAGFAYDSTLGYNDAVGFRQGTTQVFRIPGTTGLYELPLNIQDSAMFFTGRMRLPESEAYELCASIVDVVKSFGGVVTINWHDRSLVPERNLDEFYGELLRMLKRNRVWFATAAQVVEWFKRRRSIEFGDIHIDGNGIHVEIRADCADDMPGYSLRVWPPSGVSKWQRKEAGNYIDVPLQANRNVMIPLSDIQAV